MEIEFKDILNGERIKLKRTIPNVEMAKEIFETINSNRSHLNEWFSWCNETKQIEDTLKYLYTKEEDTKLKKIIEYGIYLEKKHIGNIALFDINLENRSCELGFWLSKDYIQKGFMTEAIKIIEKDAFENINLNRIQILCDEKNISSQKVAKRNNYFFEGIFREDTYIEETKNFRSTHCFSKIKSDYNKQ